MTPHALSRGRLAATALVRLVAGFAVQSALLVLPAGTLAYWQAWVYLAVLFAPVTFGFIYLLANDPELLERRMRTKEHNAAQGLIVRIGALCYLLVFLIPGVDRRFGWSDVPHTAVLAADGIILLGYGLFLLVLRENRYASRVIEVEQGQHVVTTGPYAVVRHPMYVAVLAIVLATPIALGSWWGVLASAPLVAVIAARIREEERQLVAELAGYDAYRHATKARLIPGLW